MVSLGRQAHFVTIFTWIFAWAGVMQPLLADDPQRTTIVGVAAPTDEPAKAPEAKADGEKPAGEKPAEAAPSDKKNDPAAAKPDGAAKTDGAAKADGEVKINLGGLLQGVFGGGEPADKPRPTAPMKQAEPIEDELPEAERLQDPQFLQFFQMNRGKLSSELRFVRLMCDYLTPEQRKPIGQAGQTGLKQFALRQAAQQRRMNRGMGGMPAQQEPGRLIRDAITKSLKETLTEEQFARYQSEAQLRLETQKRAIVLNVVSVLDGKLLLNEEQRDKIIENLTSHWREAWEKWSFVHIYGGMYLPQIPDEFVTPQLSSEQKKVWGGLMKVDFGWWDQGEANFDQDDEKWWGLETENGLQPKGVIFNGIVE